MRDVLASWRALLATGLFFCRWCYSDRLEERFTISRLLDYNLMVLDASRWAASLIFYTTAHGYFVIIQIPLLFRFLSKSDYNSLRYKSCIFPIPISVWPTSVHNHYINNNINLSAVHYISAVIYRNIVFTSQLHLLNVANTTNMTLLHTCDSASSILGRLAGPAGTVILYGRRR